MSQTPSCPVGTSDPDQVLLSHGGGGTRMHQLLSRTFLAAFDNPLLNRAHDGAVLQIGAESVAVTTDAYVVQPLFFPGGDIGQLAVHGTVNDLAMCGAKARGLAASFILEEGLPLKTLEAVVQSMKQAADAVGVQIVTGDTKVVDKGNADGLFIATTGVGTRHPAADIAPDQIQPGDGILLSGDLGRHGMAIMSVREGLAFEPPIESDCGSVADLALSLLEHNIEVHCLRDLTRGGLASALNEIARTAQRQITIDEAAIAVTDEVRGACELLGMDPLYVANEGRFVAFVASKDVAAALEIAQAHPQACTPRVIGQVDTESKGQVVLRGRLGPSRILPMLSGEQLPRIC